MIIFKDVITGDEIVSDSFPMEEKGGAVYEIECKSITKKTDNDFDIGANASAEEAEESLESEAKVVVDVVDAFNLELFAAQGTMKAQDYMSFLKTYMGKVSKKLQEKGNEDEVKAFKESAQNWWKNELKPKFKNYDIYRGESDQDLQGMMILLNYRDEGDVPYLTVWKHGLEHMKV